MTYKLLYTVEEMEKYTVVWQQMRWWVSTTPVATDLPCEQPLTCTTLHHNLMKTMKTNIHTHIPVELVTRHTTPVQQPSSSDLTMALLVSLLSFTVGSSIRGPMAMVICSTNKWKEEKNSISHYKICLHFLNECIMVWKENKHSCTSFSNHNL